MTEIQREVHRLMNSYLNRNPENERMVAAALGRTIHTIRRWKNGEHLPRKGRARDAVVILLKLLEGYEYQT